MRVSPPSQEGRNIPFPHAMDVPKVDGELKGWMPESAVQVVESLQGIDEHAGLGLEGKRDAGPLGLLEQRLKSLREPRHPGLVVDRVGCFSRPERNRLSLEQSGQVDRPTEKVEADCPTRRVGVHQGRVVFHAWIE